MKEKYLARVRAHMAADEIIHGVYWENGKGCAVGCTVHSGDHTAYEREMGIPSSLARIEDGIFEALSNGESKLWPERFLESIPVGADLGAVTDKFLHWLLVDPVDGVIRLAKTQRSKDSISTVAELYRRKIGGAVITAEEWNASATAAAASAYAASSAAAEATSAAASSAFAAASSAYSYGELLIATDAR